MCNITTCTGQVYINNNILGKEREREENWSMWKGLLKCRSPLTLYLPCHITLCIYPVLFNAKKS